MSDEVHQTDIIIGKFVTIQIAATISGYNLQYLRRLLRAGKLSGTKLGQVWLIDYDSLEAYFRSKTNSTDQRCGPKSLSSDQCLHS